MKTYILSDFENGGDTWLLYAAMDQSIPHGDEHVHILGVDDMIDREFLEKIQTQTTIAHPLRAEYADQVFKFLSELADKDEAGIVVMTRTWHRDIFRGMIIKSRFRTMIMLELFGCPNE